MERGEVPGLRPVRCDTADCCEQSFTPTPGDRQTLSVGLAASAYLDPYSPSSPGTAPILNSLESTSYSSSHTLAAFLSLGLS